MSNVLAETIDRMHAANKQAVEAALQVSRIAVRTQGLLARQQLGIAESCLAAGTGQLRAFSESADPQDALKASAAIIVELGEKMVAAAQESIDIQAQARDELGQVFEVGAAPIVTAPAAKAPAKAPAEPAASAPARRAAKARAKKAA